MSRFARYLGIAFAVLAVVVAIGGLSNDKQGAKAAAPRVSPAPGLPATTCDFTVLNFNLSGTGTVGATRPISVTAGDTFEQFIATPITATAGSSAYSTVNDNFSGTVSGGVAGNFTLNNLNGVLVTAPEGFNSPRGFAIQNIVIDSAGGTITAAMALNFIAFTSSPPYYPRAFNGYLHSTATTGTYAPYKFNGTIAGTIFQGVGGGLTITAAVLGRLYTGGGALTEFVTGVRSVPPDRATTFEPGDIIAQFRSGDLSIGATSAGHVTPRTTLIGTTTGTIDGAFVMDHDAQVVDVGTQAGKGWLVGEYSFTDSGGDLLTGPWLSDVSGNTVSGYVWQVIGSGVYTDSLLFGNIDGALTFGGTTFVGTMSGVYCEGSALPTATPQMTATASPTAAESSTPTATGQPGTSTATPPPATETSTPSFTSTMPVPTATSTSTVPPGSTPTATVTLCPINFSDVHPTDYFYDAVQYLYCHGAISGYSDGTFRPYNNTTRGQLSKIVVLAEGWAIDTTGGPHFSDVQQDNPFYDYIETAYNHQIISGYSDGTFRWGNNVTRAQLCKIIVSAEAWAIDTTGGPHFSDVPTTDPFYGYIETAYNHSIISGYADGTFRPGNYATRGQISKIVYNAVVSP